jgi:hypothetical protein
MYTLHQIYAEILKKFDVYRTFTALLDRRSTRSRPRSLAPVARNQSGPVGGTPARRAGL